MSVYFRGRGLPSVIVDVVCLSAAYVWMAIYSYPFFFKSISGSYREIQTYNLDSTLFLKLVEQSLSTDLFRVDFFDYGHIYFNLAILASYLYSLFAPLDEGKIFFILRSVSFLAACGTVAIVFLFAKRLLGRLESLFALGIIAVSPGLVEWANEVHPDSLQLFFLTLSLYFCARAVAPARLAGPEIPVQENKANSGFILAAAAAAGLAFSTKYLGLLLLPLLAGTALMRQSVSIGDRTFAVAMRWVALLAAPLAIVLVIVGYFVEPALLLRMFPNWTPVTPVDLSSIAHVIRWSCVLGAGICLAIVAAWRWGFDFSAHRRWVINAGMLLAIGVIFVAVFVVASPWSVYRLQFFPDLYLQSRRVAVGDWFGFLWLPYLFGFKGWNATYAAREISALAAMGGGFVLLALFRRRFRGPELALLFVLSFAVIFVTFLVFRVNRVTSVYGLPVTTPLVLLAAFGLWEIRISLTRWLGAKWAVLATAVLAAALLGNQIWQSIGLLDIHRQGNLMLALSPENQMLGEWLTRCVPTDAKILAGSYSYAPPRFERVVMAESYSHLTSFEPDVAVINKNDMDSVLQELATGTVNPFDNIPDRGRYYEVFAHSPDWREGPTFGKFKVYVRSKLAPDLSAGCL